MSDYLTKLAARALAPLPAIQPRQGSLFEPAAAQSGLAAQRGWRGPWDEVREEAPEIMSSRENHRPRVAPPARHPDEVLRNPPAHEKPDDRNAAAALAMRTEPPRTVTPVAKSPAESTREPPVRVQIAPATTAAAAQPSPPRPPAEGDSRSEQVLSEKTRQEVVPRRPRAGPRTSGAVAGETPVDHDASARRRATGIAPVRPPFAPTVVAAAPRSETTASRSPPEQAPPPPTIHVTIGRVEVRAIAPPSTVPALSRTAQRAPQLSLEDYLQHRSGDRQ